jgi:hypothetical protein
MAADADLSRAYAQLQHDYARIQQHQVSAGRTPRGVGEIKGRGRRHREAPPSPLSPTSLARTWISVANTSCS